VYKTLRMASSKGGGGGITIYAPSGDNSPIDGEVRYNTQLSRLEYYEAISFSWLPLPGGSSNSASILPATLPLTLA
jgi:hypothetical protein